MICMGMSGYYKIKLFNSKVFKYFTRELVDSGVPASIKRFLPLLWIKAESPCPTSI